MTTSIPRRRIVSMIGVAMLSPLAATPALAEELPPTPRSTEGPFYPRTLPADSDADLTRVAGRAGRAMGTPLEVSGRVLDRAGKPRAGARVEIWQCDATGRYPPVGEDDASRDPDCQGFGAVTTVSGSGIDFTAGDDAPGPVLRVSLLMIQNTHTASQPPGQDSRATHSAVPAPAHRLCIQSGPDACANAYPHSSMHAPV